MKLNPRNFLKITLSKYHYCLELKKTAVAAFIAFITAVAATVASASALYEFSNIETASYKGATLFTNNAIFATATFANFTGNVKLTLNVVVNLQNNNYGRLLRVCFC